MTFTVLLVRRYRWLLGCWPVLLIALSGMASMYEDTYRTSEARRAAVLLAQDNAATTLVYGRLADPGTAAQMFAWETGAFVTILAAVMAVVLAVALTRTVEDDGTLELLRGCGMRPVRPLLSALTALGAAAVLVAVGCMLAILATAGRAGGVTVSGAALFGTVAALTFAVMAATVVVAAQIAGSAGRARLLGFVVLGAGFVLRAVADTQDLPALNWVSPLGLRAVTRPFTADRWSALLPGLVAVVVLAGVAVWWARRREFGTGLLPSAGRRGSRLRVRTSVGLAARLNRSSLLAWTVAVTAVVNLFAAMGSGAVRQQRDGEVGGFLGSQLGPGDPATGFLAYCGTVVGIIVSVYAILQVLSARQAEDTGLTALMLATGIRRWVPLAAQAAVAAAGCAVILTVSGAVVAVVGPVFIAGDDIGMRGFVYTIGQWPAAAAMAGLAALLAGLAPRLSGLAWLPLIASTGLAMLGDLLGVPDRIQDLGFFQHVPDVTTPNPDLGSLLLLVGAGLVLALSGGAAVTRRDLRAG
ncbi:hypothetical protein [Actinoplanes sp. NPDC026670]|uniref:hypothetical protein n=1 Tax=Actinoplanes sp. NPDC026670 TaxID=3154700 RepID=UPI0033E4DA96